MDNEVEDVEALQLYHHPKVDPQLESILKALSFRRIVLQFVCSFSMQYRY